MIAINPEDEYGPYPVYFPEKTDTGRDSHDTLLELLSNSFNRLVHLKTLTTTLEESLGGHTTLLETHTSQIESINTTISGIQANIIAIEAIVGGNDFSGNYISTGMSHKAAVEALDTQLYNTTTTANDTVSTVNTHTQNISSLSGKLSDTALDNQPGMLYTGGSFVASGDKVETGIVKLSQVLVGNRRNIEYNFRQSMANWLTLNSITVSHYDTLIDESKVYYNATPPSSTVGCYSNLRQEFGTTSGAWTYYCIAVAQDAGLTQARMIWRFSGTVNAYVSLTGYNGPFTEITDQDTLTSVDTGTALVIKFVGTSSSYLYNYMIGLQ